MREDFIFLTAEKMRGRLVLLAEKVPVDKRAVIPEGFNNNIQWHMGHILTVADDLIYGLSGETPQLPASYRAFFGNGTKPSDWTEETPDWDTIISQLQVQHKQIKDHFTGKLSTNVGKNFASAEKTEELVMFNLYHEGNHAGSINAMLKVLNS
jgi:hypothetical protein